MKSYGFGLFAVLLVYVGCDRTTDEGGTSSSGTSSSGTTSSSSGAGGFAGAGSSSSSSSSGAGGMAGGGGSGGANPNLVKGSIYGQVIDAITGQAISSAEVTIDNFTVTANEQGYFTVPEVIAQSRRVLKAKANGFSSTSRPVEVIEGVKTFVAVPMMKWCAEGFIDAAAGGSVSCGAGSAVTFPPGSLNASGTVSVKLAYYNASDPKQLMAIPGGLQTDMGQRLESFGTIDVEIRNGMGQEVQLKPGQVATATVNAGNGAPPVLPMWHLDHDNGVWVNAGVDSQCNNGQCSAQLPHFSHWNWDKPWLPACVTVCATYPNTGMPITGLSVQAVSANPNTTCTGTTGFDGCVCLEAPLNSTVDLFASLPGSANLLVTQTIALSNVQSECSQGMCSGPVMVSVKVPQVQSELTWGATPTDLDLHLTGPCPPNTPNCVNGRFHIFFSDMGSMGSPPYAAINTDDTNGFGPEALSITQCQAGGTYVFAVQNYNGMPNISTSNAVLSINVTGLPQITASVPPNNPNNEPVWRVGELICSSNSCSSCAWMLTNQMLPNLSASYN